MKKTLLLLLISAATAATAQVKVGDNPTTINGDALLELESTDHGLLLPRVALTSTSSFAPLSAHTAGMTVYNTASVNDVVPGIYINSGSAWVAVTENFWTTGLIQGRSGMESGITYSNTTTRDVFITNEGGIMVGPIDTAYGALGIDYNNSPSTDRAGLDVRSHVVQGVQGPVQSSAMLLELEIDTNNSATVEGSTSVLRAVWSKRDSRDMNEINAGVSSIQYYHPTSSGTVNEADALRAYSVFFNNSNVNVTTQRTLEVGSLIEVGFLGSIDNLIGIQIQNLGSNYPNRGNVYGLFIEDQNIIASDGIIYSIYTKGGRVSFGDTLQLRSVPTGTLANGLGIDASGNVISTTGPLSSANQSLSADRTVTMNGFTLTFSGTSAITVPVGTTAERPVTPTNGMIRYNTSLNQLEGYVAGAWQAL